jgi:hypothetical protein
VLGKIECRFLPVPFEFQTHSEEGTLTRSQYFFTSVRRKGKPNDRVA